MSEEKLSFQAEVSRLLDIVANALYSNQEIFLRELISNASDACDKLRYLSQTQPDLAAAGHDFRIDLLADPDAVTLTISDNGIGMDRSELIENLGTIAKSGTGAFLNALENRKDGANLIGQFGVGFYSAFMVADRVSVLSLKAGEDQAWRWTSDGKGEFTVAEDSRPQGCGTSITLHLKDDAKEYLTPYRLDHIVKTYSDHISLPIRLWKAGEEGQEGAWDVLNTASAIWTRSKSDITDEQYREFYHHVAHAYDEPWLREHFRVEGNLEYTGLLYIPGSKPGDLFQPERKHSVKLYVRRVFITEGAEELIPPYLRFVRGVVDSEDLPLNVSREMLQDNPMLRKIRSGLVKRILSVLKKKADKDQEAYLQFWDNFGAVLKEGLYEDFTQRETLLELARFRTLNSDGWVSLKDYVAAMKEGQEKIYYISGEDADVLRRSPQVEGFRAKGVDVLILTDPVDEFWLSTVPQFEEKSFQSVTRGGTELDQVKAENADQDTAEEKEEDNRDVGTLLALLKLTLSEEVKDVRSSSRLTDSAVCLVADGSDMDMHMERILRSHKQLDEASKRILEINPRHPLIVNLIEESKKDGAADRLEDAANMLLDQARILEGEQPRDPVAFAKRLTDFMAKGLAA
ncbi:molecular chaperone HtpG [Kiloniella sp. b19]|uniref:molecular chaperone HtpG n=1 Tax=Kiloniella sp. GXU_MW_B19 TaxID=3141326 RepID=UPI0031DB3CA4